MVFLSNAISDARINESEYEESTIYGSRWAANDIPKYEMPEDEMPARVAYQLIKDELALDGTPSLNLASFVTTFMEEEAEKLMAQSLSKNFIDFEEYPQSAELANRCVNIIARLFHAPMEDANAEALGCSTVGSTEAIILATLAMKRRWKIEREKKGLSTANPNFVMGSNVQVAWHKAMRYLEIEGREVPVTKELLYMDPKKAIELVDENTIGVCAILGSTYTGHYEDVNALNTLLVKKCKENDWDIGIHVDAASGGFLAPFVAPDLIWDFQLERVHSINVSGHKYGLTYPGIGWAIWRGKDFLPEDLIFYINYLGTNQASFTFNFSKGASNIIAQYYVLIRLGKSGFTHIMKNLVGNADYLADELEKTGKFTIISARGGRGVPLVAFKFKKQDLFYDEFDFTAKLRERGWIIPAYTMSHALEKMKLARVVVREDFSRNRMEILISDIKAAVEYLDSLDKKEVELRRKLFHAGARHCHRSSYTFDKEHHEKHKKKNEKCKAKSAPGVC